MLSSWQVKRIAAQESAESPGHLRAKVRRVRGLRGTGDTRRQQMGSTPIAGWFPIKKSQSSIDDLGYLFQETSIFIYNIYTQHTLVQDQSLSMALTLNGPPPVDVFPPLTLMLCDSGIRREPTNLQNWMVGYSKWTNMWLRWPWCLNLLHWNVTVNVSSHSHRGNDLWYLVCRATEYNCEFMAIFGTLELIPGDLELLIDHVWCCIDPIDPSSWLTMSWSW